MLICRHRSNCETQPCSTHHKIPLASNWLLSRAGRPRLLSTAISCACWIACSIIVSITAIGCSTDCNSSFLVVSYCIDRPPFSCAKDRVKKIFLFFLGFGNLLGDLVGVVGASPI